MIKFFRRIRQKLLSDLSAGKAGNPAEGTNSVRAGQFSSYLFCTCGEIVPMFFDSIPVNTSTKTYTFPSREGIKGWIRL